MLLLRIRVMAPPAGVAFAVQLGKSDAAGAAGLLPPIRTGAEGLDFDLAVHPTARTAGAPPDFRGPAVQGPRGGRFIYVNSGRRAGQADSPWDRRAKILLGGIGWYLIEQAMAEPSGPLEARIAGTDAKGGPVCAATPLIGGVWRPASGEPT